MTPKALMFPHRKNAGVTPRDGLIGAAVMLGVAFLFRFLSAAAARGGFPQAGEFLKSLVFLGSFVLSMPFWLMKGQPWKAQAVIVGGTLAIMVLIGVLSPAR